MSLPLPSEHRRVARGTAQYDNLEKASDAFDDAFSTISRALFHPWKGATTTQPENWNSLLSDFKRTGNTFLNLLDISFENPSWAKALKKYMRRVSNLKKMLQALLVPSDFQAFQETLRSLGTQSKDAWQKYLPYRDEVLALVRNFDAEVEGSVKVGGFRATLMTAPRGDWDADTISQLKSILSLASAKMKRAGLGAFANGHIYAYPQRNIPASAGPGSGSSTIGKYRMGTDELFLAIGKNVKEAADILVHELGHRVYFKLMGGRGRSSWVEFYEAGKGAPPNLASTISLWKRWAGNPDMGGEYRKENDRRHAMVFYPWLKKQDPGAAQWLQIVLEATGLLKAEKVDSYGRISRSSKPALDELEKVDVQVFLNPVTAYSATSAEELFAEAFMAAINNGPRTLNPLLRAQFRRALPQAKLGSRDVCNPLLISHSWIDPHGKVHELKGMYAHESWAIEFVLGVSSLRKKYQEGKHTAGHMLLAEGWVRVANFTGVELGRSVSRRALASLAEILVKCAVKRRDVDPFEDVIFIDKFGGGSDLLSVADAVKQWGGPRLEEQMFDRLSSRLAMRKQAEMSHAASIVLMKWLSGITRGMGVAQHVYVVGGAVRNFLIDQPIKDIDMVVDSLALRGNRDSAWVAEGIARNIPAQTEVVTDNLMVSKVLIRGDWLLDGHQMNGNDIEIVNAREETYLQDEAGSYLGHKPVRVDPTSLEVDATRREFTFNTLMWRLLDLASGPDKAEIIDLTGCGLRDLEKREMRCPQDPDLTFKQDPTRIIRTIKFAFKYGFKLPPDVRAAAIRQAKGLKRIPSKTQSVLQKIVLDSPQYKKALDVMVDLGVVDVLKEMMQENKSFASFLAHQVSKKGVAYMFDLMDVGLPVGHPISFLDSSQQKRFRELTSVMEQDEALDFLEKLRNPGNAYRDKTLFPLFIKQYGLEKRAIPAFRSEVLEPVSRETLLSHPQLLNDPSRLKAIIRRKVEEIMARRPKQAAPLPDESSDKLSRIAQKRESAARLRSEWNKREAKTYTKIVMFDFDGTLFRSWEKTPDWWKGSDLDKGQYSFFVRLESLDEPCVPSKPDSSYWISDVVQQARQDSSQRGTYVVVVTGRIGIHAPRVKELLKQVGVRPNKMYFNPGMSAPTFKIRVLRSLLAGLNTVDQVEIWENENQGTYDAAVRDASKALGRDIRVTVHSVDAPPHELVCGPDDFGLLSERR